MGDDNEQARSTFSSAQSQSKGSFNENEAYTMVSKCGSEFIAVMIFVLVGSLQANTKWDGVLHAALCHGIAIFVLVACFAHISGGHVNPAVTVGIAAAGKMPLVDAAFYITSQMGGSFVGALIVRALLQYDAYVAIQGGATLCSSSVTWYQGLFAETLTTYCLVQTVLLTAVDSTAILAPLAIGFSIIMDIFAAGAISGASMNPGRSFGPNVVASIFIRDQLQDHFWTFHWIYYIGPVVGALFAAALYRIFFAKEGRTLLSESMSGKSSKSC